MREPMLIFHFVGLAMALGAGFANLFLSSVISKLEPSERGSFMSRIMILGRMGQLGLGLLLVSGFYLATPYWKLLGRMPLLIAKLSLVGILVISVSWVFFRMRRAKEEGNPALLALIRPIGKLNLLLGIAIVVLAVLAFSRSAAGFQ